MKIGVLAFTASYTADPATVAKMCEAAGFESFWLPEHPIIPSVHKTPFPRGDGKIPKGYYHMIDPFVGLALAGAATKTIKLGTGICLVPERDPIITAKEIATLDFYTGGRFLFGIGAGWLKDESEIMGVEFRRRWPMTREYVRAMKELWTKDEASFNGEFVKFPAVHCNPKPARKPYPPVHIGQNGDRGLRNTVEIGDGWGPIALEPAALKDELAKLKKMCDEAGRDFSQIEITMFSPLGGKDTRRACDDYAAAGAHRLIVFPEDLSPEGAQREIEGLARQWVG
ncbi:MAG TPA: LLM class F420-dependent oxidoreductase [Candidatus Binataceae bacterium]|nr:LLM class F420-dependent oxidoreductase [Candidatus Binataceae bacterium]